MILGKWGIPELSSLALDVLDNISDLHLYTLIWYVYWVLWKRLNIKRLNYFKAFPVFSKIFGGKNFLQLESGPSRDLVCRV